MVLQTVDAVFSGELWALSDEQWVASCEIFRQKNRRTCFLLSGHRPLYSKTANNIFAVTEEWGSREVACSARRERESYNLTLSRILRNNCSKPLAGLAWFAWVKTSDAARRRPYLFTAHRSPFNNGTQMTQMRQITADLIFWQRNKRTYFSFDTSVLMSNLIAHNSLLITQKSVVSV